MNPKTPFRIFFTGASLINEAKNILSTQNCITEYGNPLDTPEELKEKLRVFNPDGLIVRQGKIRNDTLDVMPNLKVICKHGVGVDNIDIDAATKKNIPVMITAGANYESVAVHTISLLLALLRRITIQDSQIRNGHFNKADYDGDELLNRTVGLIGFGRIGRRFAEIASCFKTKILVYDPYLSISDFPKYVTPVDNLDLIYKSSDIVSLFCQLKPETQGMINKKVLSLMKPTAYIINTARGGLINESDLVLALQQKLIAGVALDTFETEPPSKHNPLYQFDNVIFSSHVGGSSKSSLINMGVGAVENVLSVLKNQEIDRNCVINSEIFL